MSVYKQYCNEVFDEKGRLQDMTLSYPDTFNFGYDVVDRLAEDHPEKRAMVWCSEEGQEAFFTFAEVKNTAIKWRMYFVVAGSATGTVLC